MLYQTCHKDQSEILLGSWYSLFFILFLIYSINTNATTDTTKTKQQYDINDPRNPDCPCHKYQKLAEQEYSDKGLNPKINNKSNLKESLHVVDTNSFKDTQNTTKNDVNSSVVGNSNDYKSNTYKSVKVSVSKHSYHKKRPLFSRLKFRFYLLGKNVRNIKVKPNYKVCFKWN